MKFLTPVLSYLVFISPAVLLADDSKVTGKSISYHEDVRPIFQAKCTGCHQPSKAKGKYVMTNFAHLLKGGDSGDAAIIPGKPDESLLFEQITPDKDGVAEMPAKGKPLHETEIALIKKWILAGAIDDTPENVRQLFTQDNPPVYTLPPVISSIDFSPDSQILAVAGFHEVLLHKADGSGSLARLVGLSERIESVRFSPDGKKLAVSGGLPGRLGEVQVWDVARRKLDLSVSTTFDTVYGVSWSPDGQHLAYGCADNTLRAIKASNGEQVFFQGSHNDWVYDTTWSLKGEHIISVGRDRTAKLSEFKTERFMDNITSITPGALKGGVFSVQRHPMKEQILVGGSDGVPKIYQIFRTKARKIGDDYNLIKQFEALLGRVYSVNFNKDGTQLVAGSSFNGKGMVSVFKEDGAKLWSLNLATAVYAVRFSPDNKTVVAAGADGHVRLIDASKGALIKKFLPVTITEDKAAEAAAAKVVALESEPLLPESLPNEFKLSGISIEPGSIEIKRSGAYVQLIISAKLSSGEQVDITRVAKFQVAGGIAKVSPRGLLNPVKNGQGKLLVSHNGHKAEVPVTVSGIGAKSHVDFIRDVGPILSKAGCNSGTCHGSKDGKNGFKLSLRGYDALYDIRAFTDDIKSRRVNVASADKSLMLLKATGSVPHEGQQVIKHNSKYYGVVRQWIAQGAKLKTDTPRVKSIELFPSNPVVQRIGSLQQVRVIANYADGNKRDVTSEAFVSSGNGDIVKADNHGLITTFRRGEAPILARFEGAYASTIITVMGDRTGFQWKDQPANNEIDKMVAAKWKRMKILPSGLCTDDEFIRRVHIDLIGLPPTVDQVKSFLADKTDSRKKRDTLIDSLVGSDDFIDHWTNKWADLLQVNRKFLGTEGSKPFREWIRNELAQNTPYDKFASKILTASGSNKANPPASYYKVLRKPAETMENTTHLFLATRFNCNKCHDHPFERWTQDQYYELTAFFAQTGLKKDPAGGKKELGKTAVERGKPLFEIVYDMDKGETKHDRTGEVTPPKFPYPVKFVLDKEKPTRREQLSAWITSPDNQYFAKSYVNRLWGYMTGIGIIEPIDDIRAGNPPTNPILLDWLTTEFIKSGFDVRHMIRTICKSRTYQLSIQTHKWNEDDAINNSHGIARRLPAEVLFDTIYRSLGAQSRFPGVPAGTRAAQLPDSGVKLPDGFLGNLGRPARESACECERTGSLQLGPIMALISGPTVNDAISDGNNAIAKLAKSDMKDEDLVNELYLRILNRPAKEKEVQANLKFLTSLKDEHQSLLSGFEGFKKKFAADMDEKEKARLDGIAKAQKILDSYKQEIAPREKKAEDERQARIKKAQGALADFDKKLPAKAAEWEKEFHEGKSIWQNLDMGNVTSSLSGTKFEKQPDGSVFVSGKNGKGSYIVRTSTKLSNITGVRLEAIPDKRLPKGGPGRASDGNFVLSELEVTAGPNPDLTKWEKRKGWVFDELAEDKDWEGANGAKVAFADGGLSITGSPVDGVLKLDQWYHAGPFTNVSFDKKAGPEGEKTFDANKEYKNGDQPLYWSLKPKWKDGVVYGTVFSGDNAANYLYRTISSDIPRDLPVSLGSDDGIKVYLNGKAVHANNVGRGAEANQERVTLKLQKGDNHLLLKIHNQAGPSGFYFRADTKEKILPAIITKAEAAKGSIAVEVVAKAKADRKASVFWRTRKANNFEAKRSTPDVVIAKSDQWKTYRFDFTAMEDVTGLRFRPGGEMVVKSINFYRNDAPVKLAFHKALASFSQKNYAVATAIDGKVAPTNNGWAISPQFKLQMASFETKQDIALKGGSELTFTLKQEFQGSMFSLGRFRLAVTNAPRPVTYGISPEIQKLFAVPADKRDDATRKKILDSYKGESSERKLLAKTLAEANTPRPKDPKLNQLEIAIKKASEPLKIPPRVAEYKRAVDLSTQQLGNPRLTAVQDIAWALINNPAFLFNH
ncbi:MAG: DUF1549 domain-containing protein [Opitutae bacterium]|nr:DUF1549 domain-containing protein [Opitutae bacterium]MBT7853893.1 DUF1549 domain-containing protein [Opitutae bacterium]